MELSSLGLDNWFESRAAGILQPGQSLARITAVDRDSFLVRNHDSEFHAVIAGRLRFETVSASDLPCVGDWVCVQLHTSGGPALIHDTLPRKTSLRRKHPGKPMDFQMIATNIDTAFIVQGCHYDFNISRLNRYLVMANDGRIEPRIILSKADLVPERGLGQFVDRIRSAGISAEILLISNVTGLGMDEFRNSLQPGRTYCLLGSSGVGKTTLINRLTGSDALTTKSVSSTGEGVHVTVRRQMLMLDGGAMLIDTPGMRELGLIGAGDGMDTTFKGIGELSSQCRFADCTHTGEPGCAVMAALEQGELNESHYQSYIKLKRESDFHGLSYAGRRKKDRDFGRFIKSAKRQLKK